MTTNENSRGHPPVNKSFKVRVSEELFSRAAAGDIAAQLLMLEQIGERKGQVFVPDVPVDFRVRCAACINYQHQRCSNHRAAGLDSPVIGTDWVWQGKACRGFEELPDYLR